MKITTEQQLTEQRKRKARFDGAVEIFAGALMGVALALMFYLGIK